MIHLTEDGIYADTEWERQEFYKRMDSGDPVIMAHLDIWREEVKERDRYKEERDEKRMD